MKSQTKVNNEPTLFNRSRFKPTGRPLFINRSRILSEIEKLGKEESLVSLRNSVFSLEDKLRSVKTDNVGILNIDSNGDTITMSQQYIFDQLDRIAESQTIDRAKYYEEV
ncbi:MAG TPA: hypothetical protein HPP87_07655 [Planctomycetes bacterium]|nr:hypothetical protein [Planctomycetota bacterium]HIJ71224.1 hypothetical protein [Planctomycetota bacterium]